MKKTLIDRSNFFLRGLVFVGSMAVAITGSANIVGPYTADTNTLHLWHFDETNTPTIDFATVAGATNLLGLRNGATLGTASFPGFGNALNTIDGGQSGGNVGTNVDAVDSPTATGSGATITTANPTTGAFTFEAVVWIGFDPTKNFGTTAIGGTGRNAPFQILSAEGGTTRWFQWRIVPLGVIPIGSTPTTIPLMTFENLRNLSGNQPTIYAAIPTNGPDAILSNNWYHVAVSYNGIPNTANNIKFYWTLMDPSRSNANQIPIVSAQTTSSGPNPLGQMNNAQFWFGNQARNDNGNFIGLIDEVRISSMERNSVQMMFAPASATIVTQPPANLLVAAGDTVNISAVGGGGGTLGFQWLFNGTNLPASQNPTATNLTLVITNINTNQAGAYQLLVTNATSQATSTVANVQVGGLVGSLFNTGVDDGGKLLVGGAQDPHWQLVQSADPSYPGPNAYTVSSPVAAWLPNGPNSKWLAPADGPNIAAGLFTYQITFLLDTEDPTNTQITGNWVSDNQGQNIILNGVSLGITNGASLASFTPFTITNGFVAGFNTLQCVVSNSASGGNNPSGVRVELRAVGLPLPPTAPQLVSAPTNVSTQTRQTAAFSVAAVGSAPLTYQWYFGPTLLTSQTNRTLVLPNLTPAQSGTYSVIVSNNLGTTNASAALSVTTPPAVAWLGLTSGDWDTNTINWLDTNSLADVAFAMFDDVIFDDRGSGVPTVNLTQPLTPNSVLVSSSNNYTFSSFSGGFLTGNFTLTKDNTGTLILDTPNTFNGSAVILNGTLQVGNADASGTLGNGVVSNNASLTLDRTDAFFVSPSITGNGSLTMMGTGSALITGNNSYTGPTVIASGQVNARSSTALGTADSGTTVMDGAQLFIDFGINFTNEPLVLGGTGISGDGALRKGGGNATTWGGPITLSDYAGIQVDSGSSLTLTNAAAVTSTNSNFAVQCLGTGVLAINGKVDLGGGAITEFGAGTVVLSATNNNWTGGTTITGGTLQIGDGGNDGSVGNGPIEDDSTLTFLSSGNLVVNNPINGAGTLIQAGSGTLTLTGVNSYGSTRINGNGVLVPGNSQALGTGTITIGLAQTDAGYLLLNGGIFLANQFAIFPRAFGVQNNPPNVVNAAGTNIINSPSSIVIPTGGNLLTFESDSGFLSVSNGVTAGGAGRDLVMKGAGAGEIRGNIDHTANNSVLVWKLDSGTWTLWGNNTPGAATTISNGTLIINGSMDASPVVVAGGTLAGTGTFGGSVSVASGAELAPAFGTGLIGTMTISNTLTLAAGSTTAMQLNKSAGTNDEIIGLTNAILGGTLIVSNVAGSLAQGDVFPLLSSASISGGFSSIVPASPGTGLKWNLSSVAIDGTLRVTSSNQNRPKITGTATVGNSLVFSGTGGSIGGAYVLLSSTNVAAPLSTWTRVRTNNYDSSGGFVVTNTIGTSGSLFYALQAQ